MVKQTETVQSNKTEPLSLTRVTPMATESSMPSPPCPGWFRPTLALPLPQNWSPPSTWSSHWYVHFALLFYIIIYCYSLIYFIVRDDTYGISSVFTCLMIIGEFTARVRILLEKGPSRHHISEDQQFQENTQKFIFRRKTEVARRRGRGEPHGAHTPPGAG
jgi:hypothetical protein